MTAGIILLAFHAGSVAPWFLAWYFHAAILRERPVMEPLRADVEARPGFYLSASLMWVTFISETAWSAQKVTAYRPSTFT